MVTDARAGGGGRAARLDAAVRRALAADDDRLGDPQRAARLAGPGRLLRAGAPRRGAASPRSPASLQASAAATAPFAGAVAHAAPAGTTDAGSGSLLAVPPGYPAHIDTFRFLQGSLRPGAVVLDQQLAATLQAHIGDTVTITPRPGARPRALQGLGRRADHRARRRLPAAEPAARPGARAAARQRGDHAARHVRRDARAASCRRSRRPAPAPPPCRAPRTACSGRCRPRSTPRGLGSTPAQAFTRAGQIVHRVERSLPGQVQFVDNLSDQLNTAAGDALYAETLYIMLALPGALIALGLAYLAALGTVERDRRELALLRARGATRGDLLALAAAESVADRASLAGLLGAGRGARRGRADHQRRRRPDARARAARRGASASLLAIAGALAARLGASASVWRASISASRRSVQRERQAAVAAAVPRRRSRSR